MKICFSEEWDKSFICWITKLLRTFVDEGSVTFVKQDESPDLMLASIWRVHKFINGVRTVLVSNENWNMWFPLMGLNRYEAVLGICPPPLGYGMPDPSQFIPYPWAALWFNATIPELYAARERLLQQPKTKFCCFVSSSCITGDLSDARVKMFHIINDWKPVDAGGSMCNNVERVPYGPNDIIDNSSHYANVSLSVLEWIAQYKYMICFENSIASGYITEKPWQCWLSGTVPIYNGGCVDGLNQDAIINASNADSVVPQLEYLEEHQDLYEVKRRSQMAEPLSLKPFEDKFRSMILEK